MSSSTESSSSCDVSDIELDLTIRTRHHRFAVSAEADPLDEDQTPEYQKSSEVTQRIKNVLDASFLFANLTASDKERVIRAFVEARIKANEIVMEEGDEGDALYLIESGTLSVTKLMDGVEKQVNIMNPGDIVGELALLYCAPRAATVKAISDCLLWKLNRRSFITLVKQSAISKRQRYGDQLRKVKLFKELNEHELTQLVDALHPMEFTDGETIINAGEKGSHFYILESGEAEAIKNGHVVHRYKCGDYFGELALLYDDVRQASVRIKDGSGPAVCLALDRASFNRLLGPLETLLKTRQNQYSDKPLL